jgi:hypothetical protein
LVQNRLSRHIIPAANRLVAALDKAVSSMGEIVADKLSQEFFKKLRSPED